MVNKARKQYIQTKVPGKPASRKSFAICRKNEDGKWETLTLAEVEKINQLFGLGVLSFTSAKAQIDQLVKDLYKERDKNDPKYHSDNEKIFNQFWKDKYATKQLQDLNGARNDYLRVLKLLGEDFSIITSSQVDLQNHVNRKLGHKPNQHRRIIKDLNSLLRYANRPFKLWGQKTGRRRIKFLTLAEIKKVLPKIAVTAKKLSDEEAIRVFSLFVQAAFATGARTGEILAIQPVDINEDWVLIQEQLDRKKQTRDTKTRTVRRTVIIPEFLKALKEFAELPHDAKVWLRLSKNADKLKGACEVAGLSAEKRVTAHQLRHSYAMHLLSKGVAPHAIADSLGDKLTTFLDFYKDHIIEANTLKETAKLLKAKAPKKKSKKDGKVA